MTLDQLKAKVTEDYREASRKFTVTQRKHHETPTRELEAEVYNLMGRMDQCRDVIGYIEELQGEPSLPLGSGR